jgi:hypothetical protein
MIKCSKYGKPNLKTLYFLEFKKKNQKNLCKGHNPNFFSHFGKILHKKKCTQGLNLSRLGCVTNVPKGTKIKCFDKYNLLKPSSMIELESMIFFL